MNINPVKGFNDFLGEEAQKREKITEVIKKHFALHGFEPAQTPIIEREEFVVGENSSDDAVRDIYRLKDRGNRKLALRYEFTFQLKRIARNQKLPFKRYQIGPVFRDEPIKKGRTRQFIQCDADVIGSSIKDEAEILYMATQILKELKIDATVYINNRQLTNEILLESGIDEKNWTQAIREIDKLDKIPKKEVADNLQKIGAERILKIFEKDESFFKKYTYYSKILELKKYAESFGIKPVFQPSLSRGLSYYNGSVFEIWSKKLNCSICGGGSYLAGKIQSSGISLGFEPIFCLAKIKAEGPKVEIISVNSDERAISLAKKIRENEITSTLIFDKSIKKALEYANSKKIPYTVLVGMKEIEKGKYKLKEMKTGKEEILEEAELIKRLL